MPSVAELKFRYTRSRLNSCKPAMHIFVDESGTFTPGSTGKHSVSAVGALIIPDQAIKGFEKLYGRVRPKLPREKGEVKGRLLSETHVEIVVNVLRKVGALFEIVATDSAYQTLAEVEAHKRGQEEKITELLNDDLNPNYVREVWSLRSELEALPLQLYIQSCSYG